MRLDIANSAGGINGRQIKLFIEDHGYDPKKSVLAAQKLERVLANDPLTGVFRHVDAGYPEAVRHAESHGVAIPMGPTAPMGPMAQGVPGAEHANPGGSE